MIKLLQDVGIFVTKKIYRCVSLNSQQTAALWEMEMIGKRLELK